MPSADAYNATDGPLIVTAEGHSLAGRDHGPVDTSVPVVRAHVDAGRLVVLPPKRTRARTLAHTTTVTVTPALEAVAAAETTPPTSEES